MRTQHTCPTCTTLTFEFMCPKCVVNSTKREIAGLRVPADYPLVPGDFVLNAMMFLHACNALEGFMDRLESQTPEVMMSAHHVQIDPESLIHDFALRGYNRRGLIYRGIS